MSLIISTGDEIDAERGSPAGVVSLKRNGSIK